MLQNKIIRIISFSYYRANAEKIFIDLNILPLKKIVQHRISLMMYKYNYDMLPMAMNEMYVKNFEIHHHNTRNTNLLHIPGGTHTRNFRYRSVLLWNELVTRGFDFNVSFPKFKKTLKLYLINNVIEIGYGT